MVKYNSIKQIYRRSCGVNNLKITKWRKRAQIVDRDLDGEAVLLDLKTGVYYSLNEVGAEVWRLLGDGADETEIAEAIVAAYEVTPEEAAADISELINDLSSEGLIIKEPDTAP
jgi:hypothetical protein